MIIMIKNNWEIIKDLDDSLKIISENIGEEFSFEIKKIFEENKNRILDLETTEEELKYLINNICEARNYIDENEDKKESDFCKGMKFALDMIKNVN